MKTLIINFPTRGIQTFLSNNQNQLKEYSVISSPKQLTDVLNEYLQNNCGSVLLLGVSSVLPTGFMEKVALLETDLRAHWPNWGAASPNGLAAYKTGFKAESEICFSADPIHFPSFSANKIPATSLELGGLLINLKALKEDRQFRFINSKPNELSASISLQILKSNRALIIEPQLAFYDLFDARQKEKRQRKISEPTTSFERRLMGFSRAEQYSTVNQTWKVGTNRRVPVGSPLVTLSEHSCKMAAAGRANKSLLIVTRTQFRNVAQLKRTIQSVQAFKSSSMNISVRHVVCTDTEIPPDFEFLGADLILVDPVSSREYSRTKLLIEALNTLEEDYVLFLDDDDWIFPNNAERIAKITKSYPANSIIHCASQYFFEAGFDARGGIEGASYFAALRKRTTAEDVKTAFEGLNQSPFASTIWPKSLFSEDKLKLLSEMDYLEDFFLLLTSWGSDSIPVFFPYVVAGISIRRDGNSVNNSDHLGWLRARANLTSNLASSPAWNIAANLRLYEEQKLQSGDGSFKLLRILKFLLNKKNWQAALELKVPKRLVRGELGISEFIFKLKRLM